MSDHIPDLTKMIGETPRTDGEYWYDGDYVPSGFARQLERELNAANERIKRLEELLWLSQPVCGAKEDKP